MENQNNSEYPTGTRWMSTGFIAGGVQSVDADRHTLKGAVLIRPGEALGHGYWIDHDFCRAVASMSAKGKSGQAGLKARFGHPNMCSDALGTFLGRWKNITVDEAGYVRGDLHLSSTASESPKGDLRKYVEEMAAKEPDHFGASIVFTVDKDAEAEFYEAHQIESDGARLFKSPDPANVKNLPHARLSELHAADLVDDPAATDGMFSGAGGAALAAQMTEWLDTHPEVFIALQEPGVVETLQRYSKELRPFIERYSSTKEIIMTEETNEELPAIPAEPDAIAEPEAPPAEPEEQQTEEEPKADELTAKVDNLAERIETLTVERDGAVKRAEQAEAELKELTAEREKIASRLTSLQTEYDQLLENYETASKKLTALDAGKLPVSSVPAESLKSGTIFERARASKK